MTDKITIGIPVYKRTDYFREALESAINQSVKCSIVVIDNNSPHYDFKNIIEEYHNPNITYVRTDHTVPQDENFNNCFRYAKTPYVTILHDDDLLHFQFVEFCAKIIEKYGERVKGVCFTSYVSDQVWKDINTPRELGDDIKIIKPEYHFFNTLVFPGILVDREIALQIGGFRSEMHPIADVDFWYKFNTITPYYYVDKEMSYYRISPSQSTNQLIERMINNVYKYRIDIMKERRSNSFLNRLALEFSRAVNIDYFKRTYPSLNIDEMVHINRRVGMIIRKVNYGIMLKLIYKYINMKSFAKRIRSTK